MTVGVQVTTDVLPGPSGQNVPESGRWLIAAVTERGPVGTSVAVRSYSDFVRVFGPARTYTTAHHHLTTFFGEGGGLAHISRVVGPAAAVGTANLNDQDETEATNLVRVDAVGPGAWSSGVKVTITPGDADTVIAAVTYDGVQVERYRNVTSNADLVAKFASSRYVRGTILAATPLVAPQEVTLSAGADDRSNITGEHYGDALAAHGAEIGDGAVSIPGQPASAVGAAIRAHCEERHRIGLLTVANGATVDQAVTAAGQFSSEHLGLFWPWVQIPDGAGGVIEMSPDGYVAACRARAHRQFGPARPPAGEIAQPRVLVGAAEDVFAADGDTANEGRVSAIRRIAGRPRLYGWRSLAVDEDNWSLLSHRDTLNRLVVESQDRLEEFVFGLITPTLLAAVAAKLKAMVLPFAESGQVYPRVDAAGNILDPGWAIDVSPALNPPEVAANNEVRANVAIRVAPAGELVNLTITKVAVTAAL